VVIELKAGRFRQEHAGQLGFYVAAVDAQLRNPRARLHSRDPAVHQPHREHRQVRAPRVERPMAIATYTYDTLPARERTALPPRVEVITHAFGSGAEPADTSDE
jgi:hypothetical protein